jgi:hypothetical protein
MNPIGTLIEYLVNPDNVFYPYGYLVCNGDSIFEDDYPELFYHLNNDPNVCEVALPNIDIKKVENFEIHTLIKAFDEGSSDDLQIGDGEFIISQ